MNVLSERMMSEKDDSEEDQELLVKTRPKTKKPPLYKVLLINDDYTCLLYTSDAADDR